MFGRFNEVEDKPGWREKLAERRDSPLFVWQRPEWLTESPLALLLIFLAIALGFVTLMYLVVPADALPSGTPGRWVAPATTPTTSSTSTTSTIPAAQILHEQTEIARLSPSQKKAFWGWVEAAANYNNEQNIEDIIVSRPATPPTRQWAYAFLAATASALLLTAAWFTSDTRSRRMFMR